jgi:hypothetical protein
MSVFESSIQNVMSQADAYHLALECTIIKVPEMEQNNFGLFQ